MDTTGNGVMNMGFSVWLTICIFLGLWLWSSITKRRRNFHNNLHVIEEGLRRMQADIETRQRENSMGCVEDVEDISEFLKKFYEEGNNNQEKLSDGDGKDTISNQDAVTATASASATSTSFDIGNFVNCSTVSDDIRLKLLTDPWLPASNYDFKLDVGDGKRAFRLEWLKEFPVLTYSAKCKGIFCRNCVLFKPPVKRGFQGSFIEKPFVKYKNFHEHTKKHMKSTWHINATEKSMAFINSAKNNDRIVTHMLDTALQKEIDLNRNKLHSIVKTILFLAVHDIPLRGKIDQRAIFNNLLDFRAEAGDEVLRSHLMTAAKNAKYISHRIQNEFINFSCEILREKIVWRVNKAKYFSVLADETADISGVEQLSIGVRFVECDDANKYYIKEEFLGYVPLVAMDAKSISHAIVENLQKWGLNLENIVGQGYDGCSTMAGQIGGVHKIIQEQYPQAQFFHCSSHKLNLVINDLNSIAEIRNTVGTIKETIKFFRESPLRRKSIEKSMPLLCETRWSAKYKSIRQFNEIFLNIIHALDDLQKASTGNTRARAFQLFTTTTSSCFVISLNIISKYSAMLEPVANMLQGIDIDLFAVKKFIGDFTEVKKHRHDAESVFHSIYEDAVKIANACGFELTVPRLAGKQTCRANYQAKSSSPEEYYRISIFLPYLDSLLVSLSERFSEEKDAPFSLFKLHPKYLKQLNKDEFIFIINNIKKMYGQFLDNFDAEAVLWYNVNSNDESIATTEYIDLLNKCDFFPSVKEAIKIGLTLPPTTCSIERSFSTLRRVKTWLRSTICEDRLSGLCMLSVHREMVKEDENFVNEVVNKFASVPRRLQFLFK
ncbi:unnamed protein product [Psylliodes chrysocephalus]|uniref:Uncharacterized protein n=1 Tax=Psylliodes chrysocephalus TaxID=3402493 RepID=A0A9P0GCC5_9CUCU|nr:unnamed protein product [Psylliodes chrysocephala]